MTKSSKLDDNLWLEDVLSDRAVPQRDCRSCSQFDPDEEGRGFGWCRAHDQFVKLYHPEGNWHSQCQFKNIRLTGEIRRAPAEEESH